MSVVLDAYGNSVFRLMSSKNVRGMRSGFSNHFCDVGLSGYSNASRSMSAERCPPFLFPFPEPFPTFPPPNNPESIPKPPLPPTPLPELPELDDPPFPDEDVIFPIP